MLLRLRFWFDDIIRRFDEYVFSSIELNFYLLVSVLRPEGMAVYSYF